MGFNVTTFCTVCGEPLVIEHNGKSYPCICKCEQEQVALHKEETERKIRQKNYVERQTLSGMGERYKDNTFLTAKITPHTEKAYGVGKLYTERAKTVVGQNIGLYVYGDRGTGKTHLVSCIANELMRIGYSVLFTNFNAIIREAQKGFGQSKIDELFEAIRRTSFVMIDDIGKEMLGNTGYVQRVVFDVINERYNACKPTIFTSNYSIKELGEQGLDKATVERIAEMSTKIIKMDGDNFRREICLGKREDFNEKNC